MDSALGSRTGSGLLPFTTLQPRCARETLPVFLLDHWSSPEGPTCPSTNPATLTLSRKMKRTRMDGDAHKEGMMGNSSRNSGAQEALQGVICKLENQGSWQDSNQRHQKPVWPA